MAPATSDHDLIRNCIAKYAIGVDTKDWDLLAEAFRADAKTHFPEPTGTLDGVAAVTAGIKGMVGAFRTQHALSTQLIEFTSEETAKATTYCTTVLFGVGDKDGKYVTSWGLYRDELVKVAGSRGKQAEWKIVDRRVVEQAPISGDLSIFAE